MHLLNKLTKYLLVIIATITYWPMHSSANTLHASDLGAYSTGAYTRYIETASVNGNDIAAQHPNLIAQDSWQQSDVENLNLGFSNHAYWLHIQVSTDIDSVWYLKNNYALIDTLSLFQCAPNAIFPSGCKQETIGDRHPFTERSIDHPDIILPLDIEAGKIYDLYIYVATEGTYQLALELIDEETLQKQLLRNNILRGGYYAMMLVMCIYNLFLFFSIRDRSYLYYSLFVLSFLFFHMNFEGSAFAYLWPTIPSINAIMLPIAFALSQLFASIFIPAFLDLKNYARESWILYRIYSLITVVFIILSFVVSYKFSVSAQNLICSMMAIYTLFIGVRFWRMGHKPARFFTLAWAVFILGLVSGNLRSLGIIPTNLFTLYGYQIGAVLEVTLLSLALGERIKDLHKAHTQSQKMLTSSQEDAIRYLKKYEDLYQSSLSGLFQLNGKGHVTGCNPAFAKMFDYPSEKDLVNADIHLDQLIHSPIIAADIWEKLSQQDFIQGHHLTMMPRAGMPIEVMLTVKREYNDPEYHWVGAVLDITENYNSEQELKRLQESRDLSLKQLVMGISHEMNSPLGNIRLSNSYLLDQLYELTPGPLKSQFTEGLTHISGNTDRLAELNHLLQSSLGDKPSYTIETVFMQSWLKDWKARALDRWPGLDIELVCAPENLLWHGYTGALDDVLMQLLDNSVSHNPELNIDNKELYIRVSVAYQNHELNLHYQDNGCGISINDRDKIFLPFYTTQRSIAKKKGLGLYELKNFVTGLMEGEIKWPASNKGFGIILLLPEMSQAEVKETIRT